MSVLAMDLGRRIDFVEFFQSLEVESLEIAYLRLPIRGPKHLSLKID